MNHIHCPECKSDNVALRSRLRYFLMSFVSFAVTLLCFLVVDILKDEDPDHVALIGMLGGLFFLSLSIISGVYYLVKGIKQKQTNYYCGDCKNQFHIGLLMDDYDEDENILRTIRKQKGH